MQDVNTHHFINRIRAIWPKSYQYKSLEKSQQNADYLKQALQKSCVPIDSNLQSLDYLSIAEPFELEKTSSCVINFGFIKCS